MILNGVFKKVVAGLSAVMLCMGSFSPVMTDHVALKVEAAGLNTIYNDTFWKDTSGRNIYSQGGGVFKFGDTYYWYGVHYKGAETYAANPSKKNSDTGFVSVTCYSSKDLVNWKFENDVLTSNTKGFGYAYWFGRLGVAYCPKSKRYVLVAQYNESVMFASCDSPTGNFKVENVQDQITNVLKQGTGDQTVFVDDDGQAYLICSNKGGRGHQYVSKLRSSDFLYAEPAVEVAKGSGREGNCMFKYKGKYYFCASDLHGWNSSHSYYMVADNINGPYSGWKVMGGTDNDFSHVTQTGFFYTVKGTKQETVLFCGDRWSDFAGNGIGYNQWVPLTVNGNDVQFNSLSEWKLDAVTGEWCVGEGNNYILNPSFEADRVSQTTLAGWKASGIGNSNKKSAHTGNWSAQHWSDSAYKATLSQDITVPNGTYDLKVWVRSSGGQNQSYVYVKNYGGADRQITLNKKIDSWKEVTLSDIKVTNGKIQVGFYSDANAGNWAFVDDFSLVAKETVPEPIADGKYIKSLEVNDTANRSKWSVQSYLDNGMEVFGDRSFKFTFVPEQLKGAEWIRTSCDSKKYKSDEASFKAGADITAFVAVDTRAEGNLMPWLSGSGWTKTDLALVDDGDPIVTYNVYKKDVKKGEEVRLGAVNMSSAVNYVVMAKPYDPNETYMDQPEYSDYVNGDVNFDEKVDILDLILLRQAISKPSSYKYNTPAADMNGDGRVDLNDAKILQEYLANIK
ncbi:MAG: family 43 glycosylhydrolase [Ruminococcus sp.]|nr:family 43 glycosylhydrolase [Ruminococcus sp.]